MDPAFPDARQPQLAVAATGEIYLVYGNDRSIYFTVKKDRWSEFDKPRRVAEVGTLALGMRRGPRIAVTDKAIVVTAIDGKQGYALMKTFMHRSSTDGGKILARTGEDRQRRMSSALRAKGCIIWSRRRMEHFIASGSISAGREPASSCRLRPTACVLLAERLLIQVARRRARLPVLPAAGRL